MSLPGFRVHLENRHQAILPERLAYNKQFSDDDLEKKGKKTVPFMKYFHSKWI